MLLYTIFPCQEGDTSPDIFFDNTGDYRRKTNKVLIFIVFKSFYAIAMPIIRNK